MNVLPSHDPSFEEARDPLKGQRERRARLQRGATSMGPSRLGVNSESWRIRVNEIFAAGGVVAEGAKASTMRKEAVGGEVGLREAI